MKLIPHKVSRRLSRNVLELKKQSPHIFFGAGILAVAGGTVLACRATLKLERTVDDIRHDLETVKELNEAARKQEELSGGKHAYSEKEYVRDLGYVYGKSAVKLGKLYGPSVLVGGAGIAMLTGSHIQMTRRNGALTATLAVVSKAYDDYRQKIRDEYGEDRELELYKDTKVVPVEGGKKNESEITSDPSLFSPYAKLFDEVNVNWVPNGETNYMFIKCQENYFNYVLSSRGHVFLNEVYDKLGFEHTSAGSVVGWVYDGENDGYIDFGLDDPAAKDFVTGFEPSVWLDFNVDGIIYDKI